MAAILAKVGALALKTIAKPLSSRFQVRDEQGSSSS